MNKRVVYVAGPFRAVNQWEQEQNIRRAEALALEVWRAGAVAICPHLNTANFQGALPDSTWLDGDVEILRRCDAILLTPDWERSVGASAELAFAVSFGLQVLRSIPELELWLGTGQGWIALPGGVMAQ